ncbi:50S ribosomal protein L2, chloroplastic [Labeo rohita]|uniref:50S ribosomal protein L2, chloroplastic n=1 Tax=Labeo rohita TaxID=84645 RepID=A0ABQ8LDK8_LABRO|nr:50S ribosomal protein L2, chloroplastic [Labeo rohita]
MSALSAELSEPFQTQDSGSSQTSSEAPGTYGSRSSSYELIQRDSALSKAPSAGTRWHTAAPGVSPSTPFPSEPPCTKTVQDQGGRGAGLVGCAVLAHPGLVCRPHAPRDSSSLEDSPGEEPSFLGDGHNLAPASRPLEPPCVASGRDSADLTGLPQAVVNSITQARAPSTRQAYVLKWGLFADWCSSHWEDPQRRSVRVMLSFLQDKLERRLSPSTLKVYVTAIAAYHDAPSKGPLEPLASVELNVGLKDITPDRAHIHPEGGDLHAFSVSESCLEFGPADSHVTLRPRPGYVPHHSLRGSGGEPASSALGGGRPSLVVAVSCSCSAHLRRPHPELQMLRVALVCFGGQQMGNAVPKQRLAHGVVDAITLAYQCQGQPCPLGVRAHSTRSAASSWTLAHGTSLADICRAAGWATPNTFVRFYNLRVTSGNLRGDSLVSACCAIPTGSERYSELFPLVNPGSSWPPQFGLERSFCTVSGRGFLHPSRLWPYLSRTTEGERLGYICNPRSLKEGTETLRPLATILDCAGGLGNEGYRCNRDVLFRF